MLTRPWMRSNSCRSCCSLTELAVGLICCALHGPTMKMTSRNANAPTVWRMSRAKEAMSSSRFCANRWRPRLLGLDRLAIGGLPAPGARAVATLHHALLVNLGNDFAIARKQRFGRTHLGAERQLALGKTVRTIFLVLLLTAVG